MREPSENLLKTAKAECAQLITFSFNSNRKFSINKNTCLNVLKIAEIDECQLNSFTSTIKISTSFLTSVSENDESDCLFHWFVSNHNRVHFIKLSKKVNNHTITVLNLYQFVWMAVMYKWKVNKIQSMILFKNNKRVPESDSNWQQ